eukprot:2705404-Amphidinium_carterae.1
MLASLEWSSLKRPHQRVVRHAAYLHCLDCGRRAGKAKGEYNFSYLKRQDCRKLQKTKVKLRPAGFLALVARSTGSA